MRHPQPGNDSERPDVFAAMRLDHHAVLERLEHIEPVIERIGARAPRADRDEDDGRLLAFAEHLEAQFATHMHAEDEAVYPALAAALPDARPALVPLRAEHTELRDMLASLRAALDEPAGALRDEQVVVQARDLADLLRIHIRKEEAVVFTVAERLLPPDALAALRERLLRPSVSSSRLRERLPRTTKEG